jgi:dockerin type I repeat protein/EF hand domain-containing protein
MSRKQRNQRDLRRRFLGHETLENRSMLSGSPWQNPMCSTDVNDDGDVTPLDMVMQINALNAGMAGQLSGQTTAPTTSGSSSHYFDANGDGQLSPVDLMKVISQLNSGQPSGDDAGNDNGDDDNSPQTDQQPDVIGPDAPAITLNDEGFGRARAAINTDGDMDVFQVTATAAALNVALFTRPSGDMTVSVEDANGNVLASASTADAQARHPAAATTSVTAGSSYFIVVSGASGVTGDYCVQVVNNDTGDVPPPPAHGGPGGPGDLHGPPTRTGGGDTNAGDIDSGDTDSDGSGSDGRTSIDDGDGDPSEHQPPPMPAQVFAKLDTNTDASLSLDEFEVLPPPKDATVTPSDVFTRLDTDSSGGLSLDEFSALFPPPPGGQQGDQQHGQGSGPQGGPGGGPGGGGQAGGGGQPGGGGQSGDGGHPGGPMQGGPQNPPPPPEALFAKLDTDSNGSLSEVEFAPFVPASSPVPSDEVFTHWDSDSSGSLSLIEFKLGMGSLKKH